MKNTFRRPNSHSVNDVSVLRRSENDRIVGYVNCPFYKVNDIPPYLHCRVTTVYTGGGNATSHTHHYYVGLFSPQFSKYYSLRNSDPNLTSILLFKMSTVSLIFNSRFLSSLVSVILLFLRFFHHTFRYRRCVRILMFNKNTVLKPNAPV